MELGALGQINEESKKNKPMETEVFILWIKFDSVKT